MTTTEFSRSVDVRECDGRTLSLEANEAERAALAVRFDIVRIDRLEARISVNADGQTIKAKGTVKADLVQRCAVSAEDLPASINEPFQLRFVPATRTFAPAEEVEISADDCDEIEYTGTNFDLGEAVAQSVGLGIDLFATGPQAETARALFDTGKTSPFDVLAKLKSGFENKSED